MIDVVIETVAASHRLDPSGESVASEVSSASRSVCSVMFRMTR